MNSVYPDYPRLAKHLKIGVIRLLNFEVWDNCFFVRIAKMGWRFVSKEFTRRTVKVSPKEPLELKGTIVPSNMSEVGQLYRVVRVWNYRRKAKLDGKVFVLIQLVDSSVPPEWDEMFLHQEIQRDDIVRYSQGKLVAAGVDYAQAMGLY